MLNFKKKIIDRLIKGIDQSQQQQPRRISLKQLPPTLPERSLKEFSNVQQVIVATLNEVWTLSKYPNLYKTRKKFNLYSLGGMFSVFHDMNFYAKDLPPCVNNNNNATMNLFRKIDSTIREEIQGDDLQDIRDSLVEDLLKLNYRMWYTGDPSLMTDTQRKHILKETLDSLFSKLNESSFEYYSKEVLNANDVSLQIKDFNMEFDFLSWFDPISFCQGLDHQDTLITYFSYVKKLINEPLKFKDRFKYLPPLTLLLQEIYMILNDYSLKQFYWLYKFSFPDYNRLMLNLTDKKGILLFLLTLEDLEPKEIFIQMLSHPDLMAPVESTPKQVVKRPFWKNLKPETRDILKSLYLQPQESLSYEDFLSYLSSTNKELVKAAIRDLPHILLLAALAPHIGMVGSLRNFSTTSFKR